MKRYSENCVILVFSLFLSLALTIWTMPGALADTESTIPAVKTTTEKHLAARGETPEEAFQKWRQFSRVQQLVNNVTDPNTKRLCQLMVSYYDSLRDLPLQLVNKDVQGDKATLVYKHSDSSKDLQVTVKELKISSGWFVQEYDLTGNDASIPAVACWQKNFSMFPMHITGIIVSVIVFLLSSVISFVGGIWLVVVAFRTTVVWGLVTLFVPFGWLAFAIKYWTIAKKATLTMVISSLLSIAAIGVIAGVVSQFSTSTEQLEKLRKEIEG